MTRQEKKEWIELIDACMESYLHGVDLKVALTPIYAALSLTRTNFNDREYVLERLKQDRIKKVIEIRFGMTNLDATRPKGLCGEVKEGDINGERTKFKAGRTYPN